MVRVNWRLMCLLHCELDYRYLWNIFVDQPSITQFTDRKFEHSKDDVGFFLNYFLLVVIKGTMNGMIAQSLPSSASQGWQANPRILEQSFKFSSLSLQASLSCQIFSGAPSVFISSQGLSLRTILVTFAPRSPVIFFHCRGEPNVKEGNFPSLVFVFWVQ